MSVEALLKNTLREIDNMTFGHHSGFGGEGIFVEPSEEAQALLTHAGDLVEILNLKHTVGTQPAADPLSADFGVDWGMLMHFGKCPCPGVPRHMWDEEFCDNMFGDPMGDHTGRNI